MKEELHRALAAIEGVVRSEIELPDEGPPAIRIELARGADRIAVAEAVQRLLEAHGLRSKVAPDRRDPGPGRPPSPPASPSPSTTSAAPAPEPGPAPARRPAGRSKRDRIGGPVEEAIDEVSVSETARGFLLAVTAGGRTVTRRARRSAGALDEAIVSAVGELFDPEAPPPGLRAVERSEAVAALTVFLEGPDGRVLAATSLIEGGSAFALARAVWSALEG